MPGDGVLKGMKLRCAAFPIAVILAASILQATPVAAVQNDPPSKLRLYDTLTDHLSFPGWASLPSLPGHSVGEGGTSGGGSSGGDKGGDESGGG